MVLMRLICKGMANNTFAGTRSIEEHTPSTMSLRTMQGITSNRTNTISYSQSYSQRSERGAPIEHMRIIVYIYKQVQLTYSFMHYIITMTMQQY